MIMKIEWTYSLSSHLDIAVVLSASSQIDCTQTQKTVLFSLTVQLHNSFHDAETEFQFKLLRRSLQVYSRLLKLEHLNSSDL